MSILGIRIRLHPLFSLIIMASVLTGYFAELATLFGIVFIHELGHAATARGFGWNVKEIQLLPFGGVAVVEQQGVAPAWQEMLVAIAGPLQNAIMAGAALFMMNAGLWDSGWGHYFIQANLMIGCFNLLPAQPLDGGKILQALLSLMMPYYRSLLYGTWISMVMSIFVIGFALARMGSIGIQLNLLIIGIFLFYSNWMDWKHLPYQFMRFLTHRSLKVNELIRDGALPVPLIVNSDMPPKKMVRLLMRERHHLFYIVNQKGQQRAVIPEQRVIQTIIPRKHA